MSDNPMIDNAALVWLMSAKVIAIGSVFADDIDSSKTVALKFDNGAVLIIRSSIVVPPEQVEDMGIEVK